MKIIIGSPIKQSHKVLDVFLKNLIKMNLKGLDVYYYFIDDNNDLESSKLLRQFAENNKNVILKKYSEYGFVEGENYHNKETHNWKKTMIERIIVFKDSIIEYARNEKFDYLFFVDSDIVMNPNTIEHLIKRNVDIVSEVFWTSWNPGDNLTPQVWLQDESKLFIRDWDKEYSLEEIKQLEKDFIAKLKIPGIYKVGGLGACTLIGKKALSKSISFKLIPNISFWGEDRHFCIRAESYDLNLYVDTVYPAYHIYREYYLEGLDNYIENGFNPNSFVYNPLERRILNKKRKSLKNYYYKYRRLYLELYKSMFLKKRVINANHKITLSMVVKNEEKRYLEEMLKHTLKYVDEYVIIDDASTDDTVNICKKVLKDKKHIIIENSTSMFDNEYLLRKKQWNETLKTNPDWILFLDADEIFEDRIINDIKYMILNDEVDAYCFRLYDFWKEGYYRDDKLWCAHKTYRPFLIRYQKKFKYKFLKQKQHCGRMPKNVLRLNYINSDIRLKHLGWLNDDDKRLKYDRYMKLDKDGKFGNIEQYQSIMEMNPNLVKFEEENEN